MSTASSVEKEVFSCSNDDAMSENSSDAESIADTEDDESDSEDDYSTDDSFIAKDELSEEEEEVEDKRSPSPQPKKQRFLKPQQLEKKPPKKKSPKPPAKKPDEKPKDSPKAFVEFHTDKDKTCRNFKKAIKAAESFTLVKQGKTVDTIEKGSQFFEDNRDYSVVKSDVTKSLFRAVHVKTSDKDVYAVVFSVAFDNMAVQRSMGKQTAVRKTVAMCEYSLSDDKQTCPASLQKYKERLGLEDGGIFFATDNAKAYIAKCEVTDDKKRKLTVESADDKPKEKAKPAETEKPEPAVQEQKKRRIEPTKVTKKEKTPLQLYVEVAKIIADPSTDEDLDKACTFLSKYVDHLKYKAELGAMGVEL